MLAAAACSTSDSTSTATIGLVFELIRINVSAARGPPLSPVPVEPAAPTDDRPARSQPTTAPGTC